MGGGLFIDCQEPVALTRDMRSILVLALSGALLLGCKHSKPAETEAAPGREAGARGAATQATIRATPIHESSGAVASVNPDLRFVVIDFHLNPPPRVDQRMGVYRQGLKVGEVRISKQSHNSIIAADIMAGEARVGDTVRAD
jgi:hypothetical protein